MVFKLLEGIWKLDTQQIIIVQKIYKLMVDLCPKDIIRGTLTSYACILSSVYIFANNITILYNTAM